VKKVMCVIMIILILILQTGCNKDKKEDLEILINTAVEKEKEYTTKSYNKYLEALEEAKEANDSLFITYEILAEAEEKLKKAIKGLEIARIGVYKIEYDFSLISNNNVGEEWGKTVVHNGQIIENGYCLTREFNKNESFKCFIIEDDNISDIGVGEIRICFKNEKTTKEKITITVRENRGKYSGSVAKWNVCLIATLVERK